jgi:hypothetical protein
MPNQIAAACHIHSEWSYDGKWSLPALADEFGRRRYRVLMMTEHDLGFSEARQIEYRNACAEASSANLLVLPGIEYSDSTNTVHILVWGPVPFLGEGLPTNELLSAVKAANGVAVFAHPSRRDAWKKFDPSWSDQLLGIEVWNRKTDGWAPSRKAPLLLKGTSLLEFVGMDFHNRRQFFPLTMELDLGSTLDELAVIETLRSRRCRAKAFGASLQQNRSGWRLAGLHAAEHCRRTLAGAYHRLIDNRSAIEKHTTIG